MTTTDPFDALLNSLTADQLPPLPRIQNTQIAKTVVTHKSYSALVRQTSGAGDNYEKLAHVGDALLGKWATVTLLLHELWPEMNKGVATALKGRLVCCETLAALSNIYGLPNTIRMPAAGALAIFANDHNAAEMFEAHIGGLYTDHLQPPAPPAQRATQKAAAGTAVSQWLEELFTPLAQAGYNPADVGEERENELSRGVLPLLHEFIQKYRWPSATYTNLDVPSSTPTNPKSGIRCTVSDGQGRMWSKEAVRSTKAQAKTVAGWKVWQEIEAEMAVQQQRRRRF